MKLVYPEIDYIIDTDCGMINTIVIENQSLLYRFITDINNQIEGMSGETVLSENNKILPLDKNAELISRFVPFEINQKTIISHAVSELEKKAMLGENYEHSMEILSEIEKYLYELTLDFAGDIQFTKLSMNSLLKSVGMEFCTDYELLGEKIIDYMELVREYDREKLFIFVNLRSYIDDRETELFMKTVLSHGYKIVMIEASEHQLLNQEKRYIVDSDLCEIH